MRGAGAFDSVSRMSCGRHAVRVECQDAVLERAVERDRLLRTGSDGRVATAAGPFDAYCGAVRPATSAARMTANNRPGMEFVRAVAFAR